MQTKRSLRYKLVVQVDGDWFYENEVQELSGPYGSEDEAWEALQEYVRDVL